MSIQLPTSRGGVGLGEAMRHGTRISKVQARSRKNLTRACNAKHEAFENEGLRYCPILGGWLNHGNVSAAHIFPYGAGQKTMDRFFGRENEEKPEMFEIENGLMMCRKVEEAISAGLMALVPGLREDASNEEIDAWRDSSPRSYKIHVFNPDSNWLKQRLDPYYIIDANNKRVIPDIKTWGELHGRPVRFRSDHRPRARYLYWQWIIGVLRSVLEMDHSSETPMPEKFGKRFWGTGGKWILKKYLLGFAEYAGHVFEGDDPQDALQESETKEQIEPDATAVMIAAVQLRGGFRMKASEDVDEDRYAGGHRVENEGWDTDEDTDEVTDEDTIEDTNEEMDEEMDEDKDEYQIPLYI